LGPAGAEWTGAFATGGHLRHHHPCSPRNCSGACDPPPQATACRGSTGGPRPGQPLQGGARPDMFPRKRAESRKKSRSLGSCKKSDSRHSVSGRRPTRDRIGSAYSEGGPRAARTEPPQHATRPRTHGTVRLAGEGRSREGSHRAGHAQVRFAETSASPTNSPRSSVPPPGPVCSS
jgi:hypothetical protein